MALNTMLSNVNSPPSNPASFASLPRELRDEIYYLVVRKGRYLGLTFDIPIRKPPPHPSESAAIFSLAASSTKYAHEALEVLFKHNHFSASIELFLQILSEDGISSVTDSDTWNLLRVIPNGSFNVKPWIRHICLDLKPADNTDQLAKLFGILAQNPSFADLEAKVYNIDTESDLDKTADLNDLLVGHLCLRKVDVFLPEKPESLKFGLHAVYNAFGLLDKMLGDRLTFIRLQEDPFHGERRFKGVESLLRAMANSGYETGRLF